MIRTLDTVSRLSPSPVPDATYLATLAGLAAEHGIEQTGVASAQILNRARGELVRRKDLGLHDGMNFTYRNPDRSTDPQRAVPGAQAVFVGARSYLLDDVDAPVEPAGRIGRYAWVDHYAPLRRGLQAVALRLRADGYRAVAFADDNSMVDREIAYQAGIGWFGKNANLLVPGLGSWFVLGSVITTAPLPLTAQTRPDGCGHCRRCIDACPTQAIVADGVVDAARCLAWVLQKPGQIPLRLRAAVGDRLYGCDDCQTSCPPTVRFGPRLPAPPLAAGDEIKAWMPLVALLNQDDHDVLQSWGRWYLADRDPRWIRRNALVVLGNSDRADSGRACDQAVIDVISRYVRHDDSMLRLHAIWAARKLRLDWLVPTTDPDPEVLQELAMPI